MELEYGRPDLTRHEQVAREDATLFLNACFACTGQREFYSDAAVQRVSISFLHTYIQGNYRRLYARTLAAGINHFNQAEIVLHLLASGRDTPEADRAEENRLITATLRTLPPQRAWKLIEQTRRRQINNRRTRALIAAFVAGRPDLAFDAVKYRGKVRAAAIHAHLRLAAGESVSADLRRFLFRSAKERYGRAVFSTPLFEQFRQAHYSAEAVYNLPFTVAEGLATKHQIPRATFLTHIAAQMTEGERLRLQEASARDGAIAPTLAPERLPLTRLALYALSLPGTRREELDPALRRAADASLRRTSGRAALAMIGRVAAILDNSYSSSGSYEKRQRPLAIAIATHYLLAAALPSPDQYRAFWTQPPAEGALPLSVTAHGQTDLATPLLDALAWGADTILILSDGCENDPPQGAAEVVRVFRTRLDPHRRISMIHLNPVFSPDDLSLKELSAWMPTVGIRDAEDLPTAIGFARFADGSASLNDLEAYLAVRRDAFLRQAGLS